MLSPMLNLLQEEDWGPFSEDIRALKRWRFYPELIRTLKDLKRERLFRSPVHGLGHIERTILHGSMAGMDRDLPLRDLQLLLLACSYHDTGRLSDWLDDAHGRRSAYKLEELTGLEGDELHLLMAAVEAHSRKDDDMDQILASYHPEDMDRCRQLAKTLKDSDGLDRVRTGDLNVAYLRYPEAAARADFSRYLFDRYNRETDRLGISIPNPKAYFNRDLVLGIRDRVQERLDAGMPAASLIAGSLAELTGTEPPESVSARPCTEEGQNAPCRVFLGARTFVEHYAGKNGGEPGRLAEEFREKFVAQYRSDRCLDLRSCGFQEGDSLYICASFMLDVILFTYQFLEKEGPD